MAKQVVDKTGSEPMITSRDLLFPIPVGIGVAPGDALVVTHEMRFVRDVADWVVFVDDGRILRQGKPEEILRGVGEDRIERFFASVRR